MNTNMKTPAVSLQLTPTTSGLGPFYPAVRDATGRLWVFQGFEDEQDALSVARAHVDEVNARVQDITAGWAVTREQ